MEYLYDVFIKDVRDMGFNVVIHIDKIYQYYNPSKKPKTLSILISDIENRKIAELSATEYGLIQTFREGLKEICTDDRTKLLTLMYEYNKTKTLNKQ